MQIENKEKRKLDVNAGGGGVVYGPRGVDFVAVPNFTVTRNFKLSTRYDKIIHSFIIHIPLH